MRSVLKSSSRANMFLNGTPIIAISFKSLYKPQVLSPCPPSTDLTKFCDFGLSWVTNSGASGRAPYKFGFNLLSWALELFEGLVKLSYKSVDFLGLEYFSPTDIIVQHVYRNYLKNNR